MEGMNNAISKTRYIKQITIMKNTDVNVLEKEVNAFMADHEIVNVAYNTMSLNHYTTLYMCCVLYIKAIKEA